MPKKLQKVFKIIYNNLLYISSFAYFCYMTHKWLVTEPGWGNLDEVTLGMRSADLLDELQYHVFFKENTFNHAYKDVPALVEPKEIQRRLSKTILVNPLRAESIGKMSRSSSLSDFDDAGYNSIEIAKTVDKYGPADAGLDMSTMPR